MPDPVVIDTVVLRYFLLVARQDLLLTLVGNPLWVPRAVFDPDEGKAAETDMSEITRSIRSQQRVAGDAERSKDDRRKANLKAKRLDAVRAMHTKGQIAVVDLDDHELTLFADLTSTEGARRLGCKFALGNGEAACLAVAVTRGWVLATDDQDALRALHALSPGHRYERIRRLLKRAVETGVITRDEANAIHAEMQSLGFRDKEPPFPGK